MAGQAAYQGDFIAHLIHEALFFEAQPWMFTAIYTAFALLVVLTFIMAPPRRRSREPNATATKVYAAFVQPISGCAHRGARLQPVVAGKDLVQHVYLHGQRRELIIGEPWSRRRFTHGSPRPDLKVSFNRRRERQGAFLSNERQF